MADLADIEWTVGRATSTLDNASYNSPEKELAESLRGIGYALTAWIMLETRKQQRKEKGIE